MNTVVVSATPRNDLPRPATAAESAPGSRSHQRDDDDQTEEGLRQAGMKDSDFIFQHRHAQTTENTLQNDGADRGDAEDTNPTAWVYEPKPRCQDNCKKSDGGGDQTMSVFKKNPADPFRGGKEKHIVAESGRPIRDGETHAFACDHAAAANQEKRGEGSEPGEAV